MSFAVYKCKSMYDGSAENFNLSGGVSVISYSLDFTLFVRRGVRSLWRDEVMMLISCLQNSAKRLIQSG